MGVGRVTPDQITPKLARELLAKAYPEPRVVDEWTAEEVDLRPVTVTAEFVPLVEAAPALAELVANLRYEYLVAVGPEHSSVYATMNSQGRFVGATLLLADRWATKGEAQSLVDELREGNENSTARVVRRLVSEPEVAE